MPTWRGSTWALTIWNISDEGEEGELPGLAEDTSGYYARFTHPWEAAMGLTVAEVVQYRLPSNFDSMKFIAYDKDPIDQTSLRDVQSKDTSYVTREGIPFSYYQLDGVDQSYVLYPKPSTNWVQELSGEGLVTTVEDDTEDDDYGTIAIRSGDGDTETGASIDVMDVDDSVFMVYAANPTPVQSADGEIDFPAYVRKYIRYGVAARAYGANTDGRIKSLSEFWQMRYDIGIRFLKRFMRLRRQDRDYRLTTKGMEPRRNYRHPRLPDGYPAA